MALVYLKLRYIILIFGSGQRTTSRFFTYLYVCFHAYFRLGSVKKGSSVPCRGRNRSHQGKSPLHGLEIGETYRDTIY